MYKYHFMKHVNFIPKNEQSLDLQTSINLSKVKAHLKISRA